VLGEYLNRNHSKGFTLLELMVVVAMMGILTSIALPYYMTYIKRARATVCLTNRFEIEREQSSQASADDTDVLPEIDERWKCPSGGTYIWVQDPSDPEHLIVVCSIHGGVIELAEEAEPLTSLGSSFEEISVNMIELIEKFYKENGKYPRSWDDYAYNDIGLDPDEWNKKAYNGIIYTPRGKRIQIKPEEGYTFYVTDLNGEQKELSSRLNWNLMYSAEDGQWYYHNIEPGNEIDISTLEVEKMP
jgi:prepilin-type N-terminal cleavage/methylation domain-containing protein